MKSVVAEKKVC